MKPCVRDKLRRKAFDPSFHLLLDAASGVSVDHAYGYHRIPIGYTYEMRGNGNADIPEK